MVGSAQETDYAHAQRHKHADLAKWAKVCARCCHTKWAARMRKRGRVPVWLRSKPAFMNGAWGLGCTYCAAGKHSEQVQALRRKHMLDSFLLLIIVLVFLLLVFLLWTLCDIIG